MTIFRNYTFTWWQMGLFKLCLLAIGVALGAYWSDVFTPYLTAIIVVAVLLTIYLITISLKHIQK